jgi:hypothetical protein
MVSMKMTNVKTEKWTCM